jgi:hypothetical protein
LEPEAQARAVLQRLFAQFDTIGSLDGLFHSLVDHHSGLPVRARSGLQKGPLPWRRPSLATLAQVLHHPISAGASTYGRRPVAPQGASTGHTAGSRQWVPMEQWAVRIQDHLPASITWDHYLRNQERLTQHQAGPDTLGTPRAGVALLAGLFVCGTCGRRLQVSSRRTHQPS